MPSAEDGAAEPAAARINAAAAGDDGRPMWTVVETAADMRWQRTVGRLCVVRASVPSVERVPASIHTLLRPV